MSSRHDQLRQRLEESHAAVLAAVEGMDSQAASRESGNPGWAARDLLAHLAASELGHCRVIRRLLAGKSTHVPDFDLDAFNNAEVDARRATPLADLVAEYKANRQTTLALLGAVQEHEWDLGGPHPGGFDTTVEGTFRVIAIHEKRHLRELRSALATK